MDLVLDRNELESLFNERVEEYRRGFLLLQLAGRFCRSPSPPASG
jgi:hypothetical protein